MAEIERLGRKAIAEPCNVARQEDVARLVERTRAESGRSRFWRIAARSATSRITTDCRTRSGEMIDVNLNGAYLSIFAVKDEMIAQGFGRIVMVSSIAALLPRQMQIHYSASKAGVMALVRCCAEAFATDNVRVNCVVPGLVETEMADVLPPERRAEVIAATPMKRIGKPEELANLIRFLLSDESSYMTGQSIVASGGRLMMS